MATSTWIIALLMVVLVTASASIIGPYIGVILLMFSVLLFQPLMPVVAVLPFIAPENRVIAVFAIGTAIYIAITALAFVMGINRQSSDRPGGVALLNLSILMGGLGVSSALFFKQMNDYYGW